MKKKILTFIVLFYISTSIFSMNYITTAQSISWNGAFTSIADGFEAMLYNPAGLHMTDRRFGLNVFGTYGARIYDNMLSSNTIINIVRAYKTDGNYDKIINTALNSMTDTGFDVGLDLSMLNFMFYIKYSDFSLGFSMIPKTYSNVSLSKSFFVGIFKKIDLRETFSVTSNFKFIQYLDFNMNLSTRAKFLEKSIPVEAIYVGMTAHAYIPTLFFSTGLTGLSVSATNSGPDSSGHTYNYDIQASGDFIVGGFIPQILKNIPTVSSTLGSIVNNQANVGFGLGADFGFMIKFNKFIRLGFSVTDLGFIVFPSAAKISFNKVTTMGTANLNFTSFGYGLLSSIINGTPTADVYALMPATAMRLGIGITPVKHKNFDLILAADVSVSDFDRLITKEYVAFNFSTGVEFSPKAGIFQMPLRLAFNYNSQANVASFSSGIGLYLGPVEMELAVKGLEFLISGLGAKEMCVGADFKFEF